MGLQETLKYIDELNEEACKRVIEELQEELDIPDRWTLVSNKPEEEEFAQSEQIVVDEDWTLLELEDENGTRASLFILAGSNNLQLYIEGDRNPFKEPTTNPEKIRRQLL